MSTACETGTGLGTPKSVPIFIRFLDKVDWVSRVVLVGCMIAMTVLVIAQVITRYVFSFSIAWADELSRLAFVWSMFLAIPHGLRAGVHVGIDLLVTRLPQKWTEAILRLMFAFCAVLCGLVFYYGLGVTSEKMQEMMPTLDFTAAVYYVPLLIAMAHSVLHLSALIVYGTHVWEVEP